MASQNPEQAKLPDAPSAPGRRASVRKLVKWGLGAVVLVAVVIAIAYYWREHRLYASTDDAYVNANITEIAAQVSGNVTAVFVRDQQHVAAGDALFDIDRKPYELVARKAEAELELAQQSSQQRAAAVVAAQAAVAQREAELANAQRNDTRSSNLAARGIQSQQAAENVHTQVATAQAAVRAAQANLAEAQSARGKSGAENAAVQAAQAAVAQARLDLERTHVTAPVSGVVANFSLRPGNAVQAGVPVFSLIAEDEYWIDANFKETDLNRIRPGQAATITVDMYPGQVFDAVVQSISGGSGAAFSLLPPQNATGNWVKVTQRVPVRIKVLHPDPQRPLRVGTTATAKISVQ